MPEGDEIRSFTTSSHKPVSPSSFLAVQKSQLAILKTLLLPLTCNTYVENVFKKKKKNASPFFQKTALT